MSRAQKKSFRSENPLLEQVSGDGKGRVFELSISKVSLGRAEQNEIVIPHESVSREHAHVERQDDGSFVIFDNGSKNGVIINGNKVDAAPLNDGDVIQLGVFAFRYSNPLMLEPPKELNDDGMHVPQYAESNVKARSAPNKRVLIYGGAAVLLALVYFMNNSTDGEKQAAEKADGSESLAAGERFKVTDAPEVNQGSNATSVPGLEDPTLKSAEQEMSKLDFGDNSIRESEAYFRRGQREYFSKNWHRAIDAFQTSLSINKGHPLARFYLQSAVHEAEAEAKKNMEMGVKYFESLQYKRAIYHFNQVIDLLSHRPGEKVVKDCAKYIDLAQKRLQAAELFP